MDDERDGWFEPYDDADEFDEACESCGEMDDGTCLLAGTEYCDFECPFHDEVFGLLTARARARAVPAEEK